MSGRFWAIRYAQHRPESPPPTITTFSDLPSLALTISGRRNSSPCLIQLSKLGMLTSQFNFLASCADVVIPLAAGTLRYRVQLRGNIPSVQ